MLQKFLGNVNRNYGLAKSSRFNVVINGGPLGLMDSSTSEELSLLCEAVEIPGRSLITADAKTYGPIFKIPYQTQFQEISMTFLCTSELKERKFFELWMDQISNSSKIVGSSTRTFNFNFPSTYYGNVTIQNYREIGGPEGSETAVYKTSLKEAFPMSIASQPLNWSDDGFLRLSVQFTYRYYEMTPQPVSSSIGTTSPPAPLPQGFTI
jgi:hypothetical protein